MRSTDANISPVAWYKCDNHSTLLHPFMGRWRDHRKVPSLAYMGVCMVAQAPWTCNVALHVKIKYTDCHKMSAKKDHRLRIKGSTTSVSKAPVCNYCPEDPFRILRILRVRKILWVLRILSVLSRVAEILTHFFSLPRSFQFSATLVLRLLRILSLLRIKIIFRLPNNMMPLNPLSSACNYCP